MTAQEVRNFLAGKELVVSHPRWYTQKKQARTVAATGESSRRLIIDAFISKVTESGRKITRKDIWTVAGYTDPTEFQRFQRRDVRMTRSAVNNFNRVLNMSPDDFVESLDRHKTRS